MPKLKRKAKKKNPADQTLRNTQARNKRLAKIEKRLKELENLVDYIRSNVHCG